MLDRIFDTHMNFDDHMNVSNKPGRMMIFNVLIHYYVDECIHNVINLYRKQVLIFLPNKTPIASVGDYRPNLLNDSDINRVFGWSTMIVKK